MIKLTFDKQSSAFRGVDSLPVFPRRLSEPVTLEAVTKDAGGGGSNY